MTYYHCSCGFVAHVLVEDESELSLLPQVCSCPQCASEMAASSRLPGVVTSTLSAVEALQAFTGFGLPAERRPTPETLRELFLGSCVVDVKMRALPGSDRTVLTSIVFRGGVEVFLGAGSYGAVAYRVRDPFSYAARVADEGKHA